MTCSEYTAKQENKTSYNTDCIVPDLIDFIGGDDWKDIETQTEKRNIHNVKKIVLNKNWFAVCNF